MLVLTKHSGYRAPGVCQTFRVLSKQKGNYYGKIMSLDHLDSLRRKVKDHKSSFWVN